MRKLNINWLTTFFFQKYTVLRYPKRTRNENHSSFPQAHCNSSEDLCREHRHDGKRTARGFRDCSEQARWDFISVQVPWKCKGFSAEVVQELMDHLGWQKLKNTHRPGKQITQQASWNAFRFQARSPQCFPTHGVCASTCSWEPSSSKQHSESFIPMGSIQGMSCFTHCYEYSHQSMVLFTEMFVKLLLYSNKTSFLRKKKRTWTRTFIFCYSAFSLPLLENDHPSN